MAINLKSIIRNFLGFVNFKSLIQLMTWGLWFRRKRTFFIFEGKEYKYGEVYQEAKRYANFFLSERKKRVDAGKLGKKERFALGIYQENTPEYLFASFAAGLSNSVLFAINTGFRGTTLANVMNQARISHLLINSNIAKEVEKIIPKIEVLGRDDIYITDDKKIKGFRSLEEAVAKAENEKISGKYRVRIDNMTPVLVIYTSGTTGMPKGVPVTHIKLVGAGLVVKMDTHLTKNDRGYISMPLFHSNAWYVGILSLFIAGGSFVLKRTFSASAFETDMLEHGVTYMNYVGQPLHYIITALEKKYGSGKEVEKALAKHPKNKFRIAYGNGAPALDRKKIMSYLGMEHIYEIYGSTEAVITTANKPGDPIECVGEAPGSVLILNEEGKACSIGKIDKTGQLKNYDDAVGEISRKVGKENLRFDGYYDNKGATNKKFRDGFYFSGDLGHIREVNGKRYLYFNGRTDDWIRKDGENFSAENVLEYAQKLPGVALAIAYGAPCDVADEKVMVTIQLRKGSKFNPKEVFDWFEKQQKTSGMDPKWMPDYIRVIDAFSLSNTQKILVRPFKKEHFNIERQSDMKIYYRQRGDTTFHELTKTKYKEIKKGFAKTGRDSLLIQG